MHRLRPKHYMPPREQIAIKQSNQQALHLYTYARHTQKTIKTKHKKQQQKRPGLFYHVNLVLHKQSLTLCLLENFACFLSSVDFLKINFFSKILSGIPSECQTDCIHTRPKVLLGLIGVPIVCKCYQQMTLVGNELTGLGFQCNSLSICFFQQCTPELISGITVTKHQLSTLCRQSVVYCYVYPFSIPPESKVKGT